MSKFSDITGSALERAMELAGQLKCCIRVEANAAT